MQKKSVFKKFFALALLVLLVYVVDLQELWEALRQLTLLDVGYLGILGVALIGVSAYKWQLFLMAFGPKVSFVRLFNLYLIGYFVNLLVPSYIGGDAVRSWYVGKEIGQHEAFAATILERYTGLVAMVSLALIFVWFAPQADLLIKLAVLIVAVGVVVLTFLAVNRPILKWFREWKSLRGMVSHLERIQDSFDIARRNRSLILKTMFISYGFHTLTVVNTIVAAHAVGWEQVRFEELFVVLPLILLIGALPITPAGLGIQEGAFVFFLHSIGASPAQALGVGVVLRAKSYVLALIGGMIWLVVRRNVKNPTLPNPIVH